MPRIPAAELERLKAEVPLERLVFFYKKNSPQGGLAKRHPLEPESPEAETHRERLFFIGRFAGLRKPNAADHRYDGHGQWVAKTLNG